jgi:histone H3/H4
MSDTNSGAEKNEVLVISSKVKKFVKATSGLSTSAAVFEVLSKKVEDLCKTAIENAKNAKRKTLMDRDFQ